MWVTMISNHHQLPWWLAAMGFFWPGRNPIHSCLTAATMTATQRLLAPPASLMRDRTLLTQDIPHSSPSVLSSHQQPRLPDSRKNTRIPTTWTKGEGFKYFSSILLSRFSASTLHCFCLFQIMLYDHLYSLLCLSIFNYILYYISCHLCLMDFYLSYHSSSNMIAKYKKWLKCKISQTTGSLHCLIFCGWNSLWHDCMEGN